MIQRPAVPGAADRAGRPLPRRIPRRGDLARATVGFLRRGRPLQADIRIVDLGEGPMVVKDFAAKSPWMRRLGRLLIAHEHRAYRRLEPLLEIPALLGRIDAHALALEMVHGVDLTQATGRCWQGSVHLEGLRRAVARFRTRLFFHLDLRSRRNVLIREDGGGIVIVDLAASVWFRKDSRLHRLAARGLGWYYDSALLKWKAVLTPRDLTAGDRRSLARFRLLRGLWIFNLKGSWRRSPMAAPAGVELTPSRGDVAS